MTKIKRTQPVILLVLIALVLLATACSPSAAEKLNQDGNEAFEKQAYENALAAYQSAQIKEPELAEPYYNAANTLYRQGQYEAALEQLNMALSFADEESLATNSFFNLGNSSYNMQDLSTAVAAYTESLLRNPDDQDAKYNLELALQQQEQQQQEQEQEQQEQEQEQESEQSEDGQEGEQEQEQESENGEGEQQQEQESEQSETGQEGEQEQEQQDEQSEGDQQQDGQEGQEQEQEGQPQSGQADENQDQQGQPSQVPAPGQKMTEEQAQQLLAAIADDSQTLQEKLGQIFAVPWTPPVQDW